jgi:hypothetical protein
VIMRGQTVPTFFCFHFTAQSGLDALLWTCIRDMVSLGLGHDTDYLE